MTTATVKAWGTTWEDQATIFNNANTVTLTYAEPPKLKSAGKPGSAKPSTVDIGGITLTAAQLADAAGALKAAKGAQVIPPLKAINSPLAEVDHHAVAAVEMKANPALRKGSQKTKTAFLAHLEKKLNQLPPLADPAIQVTAAGPAVQVKFADLAGILDAVKAGKQDPLAQVMPDPGYQTLIATGVAPHEWPRGARWQYLTDHQITGSYTDCCWHPAPKGCGKYSNVAKVIAKHLATAAAAKKAAEDAVPKYSYADPQPDLAGFHRKHVLVDQHGNRYLFKPAPEGKRFRPETEHAAHLLARLWGYPTADSRLIEFDGMYGQAQRMFVEIGNLAGFQGADFNTLSVNQLTALAREHLLDWALDNDDAKGDNVLVTDNGGIVGVDKARAWIYFGGWDGLSSHDSANSNAPLVYTELYRAIKDHQVDQAKVDAVYQAVIAKAQRMQRLPDATLAKIISAGVANRPHYKPPAYRAPFPGAPTNAVELIAAATTRKNQLAADMQALWERIYADAGWPLPELAGRNLGANAQGHPLYAGLHEPGLHAALAESKSYGTPTFVAGTDIEDAHILLWREKAQGVFRVRGQWKTRGKALERLKKWCRERATAKPKPPSAEPELPGEVSYYRAIIGGAKTISYHWEDGEYNLDKIALFDMAKAELGLALQTGELLQAQGKPDPNGEITATVEMAQLYLGYIQIIEVHKEQHTRSREGDFPRYVYTPKQPEPQPEPDPVKVEKLPASRAAAHRSNKVLLADDGELELDGTVLTNDTKYWGQPGDMYLVTLPTGEQIEFRAGTATPLSTVGLTQFTIPDQATIAESLRRIDAQLAAMGLAIEPAGRQDLELYYWRHLASVMSDRADSRKGGNGQTARYKGFWAKVPADPTVMPAADEIEMWRTAFATLTSREQIDAFVAADGHLPRFMHMDLRNPELPCGKPYWDRFDVTDEMWRAKQMPTTHYRTGPRNVIATGVSMATEARIRTFAIWKWGQSSAEDMNYGSAAYVFARQNQETQEAHCPTVFYNPRVLRRTTNYAFDGDLYGRIEERCNYAFFDFDTSTAMDAGSNELLVKDAMSLLDDIEILVFEEEHQRSQAIKHLAGLGITDIRGLPVTTRFITRDDNVAMAATLAVVKESLANGQQPG